MNWESDRNYWVQNIQHKLIFKEVYRGDTTRDKKRSSMFMWGLALIYNPTSEIVDWKEEKKIKHVEDFLWKKDAKGFKPMMKKWASTMESIDGGDTSALRQLREWERIMDEKSVFLAELKYDKASYKMIEEMLSSNGKLYAEYDRIMQLVRKESIISEHTIGKGEESLLEQGKLDGDKQ